MTGGPGDEPGFAGPEEDADHRTDGGDAPSDEEAPGAERSTDEQPSNDSSSGDPSSDEPPTCDEAGCSRGAGVVLHIPWGDDRAVCPAHARVLARPDGVVAEPIKGAEAEWP